MPVPALMRRQAASVAASRKNLLQLALADSATVAYVFNEASGNLLDKGTGGWNLASHAQVTLGAAGVNAPDKLAYTFISTSQGSPTWGHTQGNRPLISPYTKIAFECVCKIPSGTNQTITQGTAVGTLNIFGLGTDANGDVTGYLALTGGNTQAMGVTTRTSKQNFQHYIWQYDGTIFTGYVNGVQAYSVTTTIGSATFFDDTLANARLAIGGASDSGASNTACTVDFYAQYNGLFLSAAQIARHFASSGC